MQAAEAFGWQAAQSASRVDARWRLADRLGLCHRRSIRPMSAPRPRACGLMPNGQARVQIAAHDIGTGAYTVIGQMAAERLGVPLSNGYGRARRQPASASAGGGRIEHHGERLLGRDEGLRRHPPQAFHAPSLPPKDHAVFRQLPAMQIVAT